MTQLSYPEQLKLYLQSWKHWGGLYLEMDELNKLMPASRESLLAQMHDSIRECTLCKLCKGRRQVVLELGIRRRSSCSWAKVRERMKTCRESHL